LSSPRRRRRLLWLVAVCGAVAFVAVGIAILPSHGSSVPRSAAAPRPPTFGATTSESPFATTVGAAEERARTRAEAAVRPLAERFITSVAQRKALPQAHDLLAPTFVAGSVDDWTAGRKLPVELPPGSSAGGTTIAYSGASEVGVVETVDEPNMTDAGLVAMRFEKQDGAWLITYIHGGHASSRVDATNYSPAGFLPGSHRETAWTWLILIGGLVGIVALAALFDRGLSRRRSSSSVANA
jgi:hypothetical protein